MGKQGSHPIHQQRVFLSDRSAAQGVEGPAFAFRELNPPTNPENPSSRRTLPQGWASMEGAEAFRPLNTRRTGRRGFSPGPFALQQNTALAPTTLPIPPPAVTVSEGRARDRSRKVCGCSSHRLTPPSMPLHPNSPQPTHSTRKILCAHLPIIPTHSRTIELSKGERVPSIHHKSTES